MVIFHCYVSSPEGTCAASTIDWWSLLDARAVAKSEEAISTLALPTDSQHCQGLWDPHVLPRQGSPITGVNATIVGYLRNICKDMSEGNCFVILRFNNACAIPMPPHPLKILLISRYLRSLVSLVTSVLSVGLLGFHNYHN